MAEQMATERERDAELAEYIGWQRFPYMMPDPRGNRKCIYYFCPPGAEIHVTTARPLLFHYDPAAMWTLIDAMVEKEWHYLLEDSMGGDGHVCTMWRNGERVGGCGGVAGSGSTPMAAVAKAALAALSAGRDATTGKERA